ncbi:hypothetical protein TWF694_005232 [Orbilia ellipsospora]|uniref:Uncharacterized protein n=1 Tax=Orbilia ellipsospora TaxID=2528407 RepID=A0AAV9WW87_9PEZI
MKTSTQTLILSFMALGASALNVTCPATYDPSCAFICGDAIHSCSSTYLAVGANAEACTVCPGVPSTCPATSSSSCAFVCSGENTASFCYASDISGTGLTCKACGSSTGTASNTASATSTGPPTSTSTAGDSPFATCPATFTSSCAFICGGTGGSACSSAFEFSASNASGCNLCTGGPSTCPSVPDASCAFVCSFTSGPKFCYSSDLSTNIQAPSAGITCQACSGTNNGGSQTTSSSSASQTSVVPPPAYTGGATVLKSGGMVAFGLVGIALAL